MAYKVPFVDAREHYRRLKSEIDGAIVNCLTNGDLIYRQQLRDFEAHLAEFVGVKHAVGLNSGYHALEFSLRALGIGKGDEVITTGHTFVATVSAIVNCGATPILVEVGQDFNMAPDALESAITARTKAIIPVHLNGRIAEMSRIMEIAESRKIPVVEDACQALGASISGKNAGSIGATGCWSFYPFKVLGGFGDGGAITTNNDEIARIVRLLRYNGEDRQTGEYHYHGATALLDNVQAAVLDVKLRHLPSFIEHRRTMAKLYHESLTGIGDLVLPPFDGDSHIDVFQNYVVMTTQRERLRQHLYDIGVETLVSWPKPMWEHPRLNLVNPNLKFTEMICREVLSLPMSAETTAEHIAVVVHGIKSFFEQTASRVVMGT